MESKRDRLTIIAATRAYVLTYTERVDDAVEGMHARDQAHFAAYNATLTAGMHKDQAHDLATQIDELVTAALVTDDDAAGGEP